MKKTIILTENDLNTLTSGGEVRFDNEDSVEIHVVTQATLNRRKAIEELRDILMRCGALTIIHAIQDFGPRDPESSHAFVFTDATLAIDYNKLAEAAYDHLMGE